MGSIHQPEIVDGTSWWIAWIDSYQGARFFYWTDLLEELHIVAKDQFF